MRREIIPLPEETVRKIDNYRGQASRAGFISKCIEFSLEKVREGDLQPNSSTNPQYLPEAFPLSKEVSTNSQYLSGTSSAEGASKNERAYPEEPPFRWKLWIAAILTYGIGDLAFTFAVLYFGGIELNPIIRYLAPGNPLILIPLKVSVLSTLFLLAYFLKEIRFIAPLIALVYGAGLVLHNLTVILLAGLSL